MADGRDGAGRMTGGATGGMTGRVEGVVLDKDGTLFDFQATWGAWAERLIAAESGGDGALALRLADALGFDGATGRFRPDSVAIAATVETAAARLLPLLPGTSLEGLVARMNAGAARVAQVEAAPIREVLGALRRAGLKLGIATNDGVEPTRVHLAGVADLLDFVAGYDSGHGAKPGPGQLLAFARAVGLDPGRCAMVGDSLHDLAAARAAGMRAVGVLTGPAGRETLAPAADAVLGTIAELPAWVEAQGA